MGGILVGIKFEMKLILFCFLLHHSKLEFPQSWLIIIYRYRNVSYFPYDYALLKTLFYSILTQPPSRTLNQMIHIFQQAQHSSIPKLSKFCKKALLKIQPIIRPRAPPLFGSSRTISKPATTSLSSFQTLSEKRKYSEIVSSNSGVHEKQSISQTIQLDVKDGKEEVEEQELERKEKRRKNVTQEVHIQMETTNGEPQVPSESKLDSNSEKFNIIITSPIKVTSETEMQTEKNEENPFQQTTEELLSSPTSNQTHKETTEKQLVVSQSKEEIVVNSSKEEENNEYEFPEIVDEGPDTEEE